QRVRSHTPEWKESLEARLGREAVRRIYSRARRARARSVQGRVVVIHGILGGQLRSVEDGEDGDRIWLNYLRLLNGRIQELKLDAQGGPADPHFRIEIDGLIDDYYLPMVMELADRWQVLAFAYHWRIDIDKSADRLAQQVRQWANGQPAHIVAHSMGGLVSRRFIQKYPEVWNSRRDPNGLAAGGRLVMLGTPNRGSLDIAQVGTGAASTRKMLRRAEFWHAMDDVLAE